MVKSGSNIDNHNSLAYIQILKTFIGFVVDLTEKICVAFKSNEDYHFDDRNDSHMSSIKYEENGCSLDLENH